MSRPISRRTILTLSSCSFDSRIKLDSAKNMDRHNIFNRLSISCSSRLYGLSSAILPVGPTVEKERGRTPFPNFFPQIFVRRPYDIVSLEAIMLFVLYFDVF